MSKKPKKTPKEKIVTPSPPLPPSKPDCCEFCGLESHDTVFHNLVCLIRPKAKVRARDFFEECDEGEVEVAFCDGGDGRLIATVVDDENCSSIVGRTLHGEETSFLIQLFEILKLSKEMGVLMAEVAKVLHYEDVKDVSLLH